jgi:hypothetical protein
MEKVKSEYEKLLLEYPKIFANNLFYETFGREINWGNPQDLNEKINWLSFNTDTTKWSELTDKYRVREFLKEKGLSHICNEIYEKWDSVDDINFDKLPKSFVIKTNCGSGDVLIIKDKTNVNLELIKNYFKDKIKMRFGIFTGEPHYLRIKPCIFAEKLLDINPIDYKIWCFNGKPHCILVASNRKIGTNEKKLNAYDLNWNHKPEWLNDFYKNDITIQKPTHLEEMLKYASILSKDFPQVRVDFYEINDKVYFSEMTFTASCGRMLSFTQEKLLEMGKLCLIN